jgi:hypothetical protein
MTHHHNVGANRQARLTERPTDETLAQNRPHDSGNLPRSLPVNHHHPGPSGPSSSLSSLPLKPSRHRQSLAHGNDGIAGRADANEHTNPSVLSNSHTFAHQHLHPNADTNLNIHEYSNQGFFA